MKPWLRQVRHDLLKHPLWPTRDLVERHDAGTVPRALQADLQAAARAVLEVPDEEGAPVGLGARWRELRAGIDAEAQGAFGAALDAFAGAVARAESAARDLATAATTAAGPARAAAGAPDWRAAAQSILALEDAFARLARELNPT